MKAQVPGDRWQAANQRAATEGATVRGQRALRRLHSRFTRHKARKLSFCDGSSSFTSSSPPRSSVSVHPPLRCASSWLLPDSPGWKTTGASQPLDSSFSSLPPSLRYRFLLLLPSPLMTILHHFLPSLCLALSPYPDCCLFARTSSQRSYSLKRRDGGNDYIKTCRKRWCGLNSPDCTNFTSLLIFF